MTDHEKMLRELAHRYAGEQRAACLAGADALRREPWQPIETASRDCKDRTSYLVFSPDDGIVTRTFRVKGIYRGFNWGADTGTADPTHWMPLPAAPTEPTR